MARVLLFRNDIFGNISFHDIKEMCFHDEAKIIFSSLRELVKAFLREAKLWLVFYYFLKIYKRMYNYHEDQFTAYNCFSLIFYCMIFSAGIHRSSFKFW